MRRRLGKFLPIVLIALLVQIFAPVAACLAASTAASDPLQGAIICHGAGPTTPGSSDQNSPRAQDRSCSLCCVAHSAAPLDTPSSAFTIPVRKPERVIWLAKTLKLFSSRAGSHAQARAPPSIS